MGSVIRLNLTQFQKIAKTKGWENTSQASKAIGCQVSTLSRILRRERSCGGEFIANLLTAADPWDFNDLFFIEESERAA